MVSIQKVDNAIRFTFENSSFYLYNDGTVNVPLNALTLVLDEADMANFVKASSNDNLFSIPMSELSQFADKAALQSWFEENAYGGGGITPEEVAEMIDEAVAPVEDDIETIADDINEKEEVVARALTDLHENKLDVSAYTPTDLSQYWTSAQTEAAISTATSGKQDTLTAGSGISINNDVISVTVDPTLDSGSTNPVANSVITNGFNAYTLKANNEDGIKRYFYVSSPASPYGGQAIWNFSINGRCPLSQQTGGSNTAIDKFKLVETSAITSSITASSTNAQVPSAKAVYDQLGGLKLVKCTQAEYDALVQGGTVDADTLYVITNVV